jgi:hypothetical protein
MATRLEHDFINRIKAMAPQGENFADWAKSKGLPAAVSKFDFLEKNGLDKGFSIETAKLCAEKLGTTTDFLIRGISPDAALLGEIRRLQTTFNGDPDADVNRFLGLPEDFRPDEKESSLKINPFARRQANRAARESEAAEQA